MVKTGLSFTAALAIWAFGAGPAWAQTPSAGLVSAQRAALSKLAWMDGTWRGEAVTQGSDVAHRVVQTERIGNMLDGSVKVVEGKGFNADGTVGFNAIGVISFDPASNMYAFRSYAQGRSGTFTLTPTDTGYIWDVPAGPMTIRYTATFKDGIWNEVGDRIMEGQPPKRFFEMNLKRTGATDWPMAGSQKMK